MRKSDKTVSQYGVKRARKNLARKTRRFNELESHIQFLCRLTSRHQIDFEKFNQKNDTKYIIDRLVSYQNLNK